MAKISEIISNELADFDSAKQIVKGLNVCWPEIVRRITFYMNDRFLDRPEEDEAVFWNLATTESPHSQKNIDTDVKDYKPEGQGDINIFQAWVLKMKFEKWAIDDSDLATVSNEVSSGLTDFGMHILKKVPKDKGKKLESCNLSITHFNVLTKDFEKGSVIEEHEFTESQLWDMDGIWDASGANTIEQAIANAEKADGDIVKYKIFERTGNFSEGKKSKRMHHIVCGSGDKEVILFEEELKKDENIYFGFTLGNSKNRYPGIGVYERLFNLQVRANTLVNQNAESTAIASLLLLRSKDPDTNGNVLTDAINGQIIESEDLEQIGIDNRGLQGFLAELNKIEDQARKLCMTPEVVTGENLPSGTPFRSMATLTSAAKSAFKKIRDNYANKLAKIIKDDILPDLVKDWNKEDLFEIANNESDIQMYDDAVLRKVKIEYLQQKTNAGQAVSDEEMAALEAKVKKDIEFKGRKVKTKKGFFNFKFGIRINPVGEMYDKSTQNDAYFNAINWIMQNPAVLNLPLTKQYLENNGIQWWKLRAENIQEIRQSVIESAQKMPMKPGNNMAIA